MIEVNFSPAQLRSINKTIEKLGDAKTARSLVSKAARTAGKVHLLPQAKAMTPVGKAPSARRQFSKPKRPPGLLRKSTKLRTIKRQKDTVGIWLGYSDFAYVGDTFYGGFVEYGFTSRGGNKIAGQFILKKVADQNGKRATEYAAKLIADAMLKVAKRQ